MSTTVALAAIAGHTVIILAAIHYGVRALGLLLPQLRVQAPPKPPQDGSGAQPPAATANTDHKQREVSGGTSS